MQPVVIIAGRGPAYGTGHLTRMRKLERLLQEQKYVVRIDTDATPTTRDALYILDHRDLSPRPFLEYGPVIALDNRHSERETLVKEKNIIFHDTLPHPATDLNLTLDNALIAPELSRLRDTPKTESVFSYSGDAKNTDELDDFLARLVVEKIVRRAFRCGRNPPNAANKDQIEHCSRLEQKEFYARIAAARYAFCYFGVALLEAWYLQCRPVLYSIASPVHERLMRDLSLRSYIPCFEPGDFGGLLANLKANTFPEIVEGPSGRGFGILLDLIKGGSFK